MKKAISKQILIFSIILILIFILIRYFFDVNTTLNIIRTFASLGTLIIALVAFDQFGLKRSRKLKELELVVDFYNQLKRVVVYGKTKNTVIPLLDASVVRLHIRPLHNIEYFETSELEPKWAVYTSGYQKYFNQNIKKIVEDIFFPEDLHKKFKFIEHDISRVLRVPEEDWDFDDCIYLSTTQSDFSKVMIVEPLGVTQIRFQHVLNNYKTIIKVTEEYLKTNNYNFNK